MAEYAADSNQQLLQQIEFGEVQVKPEAGDRTECRKGSWTLQETVVLIAAKKLDDDRRLKLLRAGDQSKLQGRNSRPRGGADQQQVRWKWVENYCWKFGCLRNQNQCSDKWDNLLRDYKKVRDYEELRNPPEPISYWMMEKHERKEKGLPSNLLKEVYCAIQDVVADHSRFPARKLLLPTAFDQTPAPAPAPGSPRQHFSPILQIPATSLHSPMQKRHAHEQFSSEPDPTLSGTRFLIPYSTSAMVWCNGLFAGTWSWTNQLWLFQTSVDLTREFWRCAGCGIAEGDKSSFEDAVADQIAAGAAAAAKRRKVHANNVELEGSAAAIAPSMFKSTVEIMQTLLACEDKKDRRHRDLLGVEERKLHIEEAKTEISRAGVAGLITAVNTLASAILLLAADTTSTTTTAAALDRHVP